MKYDFDQVIDRTGTHCFKYDIREKYFGKKDVIPMWVADMDIKTPGFIMDAIKKRADHPVFGYTFKPESYYQSIINWLKKRHGWEIKRPWLVDNNGVVPSLDLLVHAFTNQGDKIVVQPPVYFPFFSTIENKDRQILYNPLQLKDNQYVMDLDHLKKQIDEKTKMIFLCSPHNPGGRVWSRKELQSLMDICLENNILVVSDEIHADLVYKENKHIPTATLSEAAAKNSITCISASKTFNIAGFSLSSVIIPQTKLRQQFKKVVEAYHGSLGNIFGDVATEAAFSLGEEWLDQLMVYLEENRMFVMNYFKDNIPVIKPMFPQATYLVWLDCRKMGLDNDALRSFMIEEAGLGFNHGPVFRHGGEGFQRMNIGCPKSILKDALEGLQKALKRNGFLPR